MVLNSYKYGYQVQWKCTRQLTTISNKLANLAIHGYIWLYMVVLLVTLAF